MRLSDIVPLPEKRFPCGDRFVVGMTTAPRPVPTLSDALGGVASAGFDLSDVRLFCDGIEPPSDWKGSATVHRPQMGAFPCFVSAMAEMFVRHCREADWVLMLQDDAVLCEGLKPYLVEALSPCPVDRLGFVSLFTSKKDDWGVAGWQPFSTPETPRTFTYTATALLFPMASLEFFLRSDVVYRHRQGEPFKEGLCQIDAITGRIFKEQRTHEIWLPSPSLCKHIGETSSIWGENAKLDGFRKEAKFAGDLL